MQPSKPDLKVIFTEASALPPGAGRSAYLDGACHGDAALRGRVEALLAAQEEIGHFLESSAGTAATEGEVPVTGRIDASSDPGPGDDHTLGSADTSDAIDGSIPDRAGPRVTEGPGTRIGPYKLLQKIGEGGMGVVYVAEQERPVHRKVALKIIKPGMDTDQVVARFEAERQALALMDHPNIAKVLDAGATDSGRPFFVMELVNGIPITDYCDQAHLSTRERLELFVPVCLAIQHAHQKGIIHRDVKPTNVLVTLFDDKPVPKVIDFGVAKATAQRLTERTLFTGFGAIVGTLEYMSPEQAAMSGLDVDTRSDIYSLGVLLYELLTGTTPLERAKLRSAAYAEILRRIREEEPPAPSTRLSDSGLTLASIAAQRGTAPARLARLVRGELDWIVMRALEKDRSRRYETASGFARDIERHLADDAVEACPPSVSYRARKFVRKNRTLLATASGFAGLLALGTAMSTWQAIRATKAEKVAVAQRNRAVAAEVKATESAGKAKTEAAIAEAVNDFLINDLLAEAAPAKNAREKQVTVESVLDKAAAKIAGKFADQPPVEAAIRHTVGATYRELGLFAKGVPHLERTLEILRRVNGLEHSDTLGAMNTLARLYGADGQYRQAERLHLQALEVLRRVNGPEHPGTLRAMHNLASEYGNEGRYAEAEAMLLEVLEIERRVLGPEDMKTIYTMNNLASTYESRGRHEEAEALHAQSLELMRRVRGPEHPDTLIAMSNLALLYAHRGRHGEAEALCTKTLEIMRRVLGPEHPDTLGAMGNLAEYYSECGRHEEAEALHAQALEVQRRVLGSEHPETLKGMGYLADRESRRGRYDKAEVVYRRLLEVQERIVGDDHPDTASTMANLADNLLKQRKFDQAEPLLRKVLTVREKELPSHALVFNTRSMLGGCLMGQQKFAEAEPLLLQGLEGLKARESMIPPRGKFRLIEAAERIVQLYDAWGKPAKAAEWRVKLDSLALPRRTAPSNSELPTDPFAP
jgi:eukaryotic-like serine/threonine-protein kinase